MTTKNTMGGARPRNESDAYFTPDALAQAITDALRDRLDLWPDTFVEPSAGDGAFVRAASATWPGIYIHAVEPDTVRCDDLYESAANEVTRGTWEEVDSRICRTGKGVPECAVVIAGNPPFNLPGDGKGDAPTTAERHVMLALDRLPEGGHVAFLLRLAFLSGGGRIRRLYSRHPLRALWPVTPRPSFTGGGTDGSEYGVFVWRKGWTGPQDLRPLEWAAPARERRTA